LTVASVDDCAKRLGVGVDSVDSEGSEGATEQGNQTTLEQHKIIIPEKAQACST
jgi:hypothetical protein